MTNNIIPFLYDLSIKFPTFSKISVAHPTLFCYLLSMDLTETIVSLPPTAKTVIGSSVCLVPVDSAVVFFPDYTRRGLLKLFRAFRVPVLFDKYQPRFNLYTLEAVLHYLLLPNSPSFALPGSDFRDHGLTNNPDLGPIKISVSDSDIEAIFSPAVSEARGSIGMAASLPRINHKARVQVAFRADHKVLFQPRACPLDPLFLSPQRDADIPEDPIHAPV